MGFSSFSIHFIYRVVTLNPNLAIAYILSLAPLLLINEIKNQFILR